jgi:hypothetical protein
MRFLVRRCVPVLLLLVALSCGGGPSVPPLVPVSGKVQLDGRPLPGATVAFRPVSKGKGEVDCSGMTDEQGQYKLRPGIIGIAEAVEGAVVGEYHVSISKLDRDAPGGSRQVVPDKYHNAKKPMSFTVPAGGSKDANFDMSSK